MPWSITLEIELPDEFKSFGETLEEMQLALRYSWIGFAKNVALINQIIGKLKHAKSFEEVKQIAGADDDHQQIVEVVMSWFEAYAEHQNIPAEERFNYFRRMMVEMESTSEFNEKLKRLVFNGERHALIKNVTAAKFIDKSAAECVDARTLEALKPKNYANPRVVT